MRASDLMTRNPTCVTATDSAQDVANVMATSDCGCVPVVADRETRRLIGVVTDRDLAVRGVARGKTPETQVGELMTRDVAYCSEDADLDEVERLMADRQIRRVVIANADGCCIGIVSQADLARAAERGRGVGASDLATVVEQISKPGV